MKLRIMGTSEEVKQLTELLPAIMNVSSVSGEYPNRGSNNVRVYVDGAVEEDPYTEVMKKYAETKEQLDGLFLVATTSSGDIIQANSATNFRDFLFMMHYLTSEDFAQILKENMESFFQGKTHKESEAPKNAC